MSLLVDIEKTLGSFRLQVCFSAEEEVLSLFGASGCGKSMTLKCIAGIVSPDRGKIILNGKTLYDSEKHINLPPQKRRVGYLFQQYALFPNMTVSQNVACGVREKANAGTAVPAMLRAMHLEGLEKKRPSQLSGGQQQRTALARILVNEPEVLLLDEPFSALDSHLRFQLEEEVRSIIQSFGKTVLFVSHNREEVFRLSRKIALMRNGSIERLGDRTEVFANPESVEGALLTGCRNLSRVERRGNGKLFAADWGIEVSAAAAPGDTAYIGVRAHDLRPGSGEYTIPCRVMETIENPFSVTVNLLPYGKNAAPLSLRVGKEQWNGATETMDISFSQQAILFLKE